MTLVAVVVLGLLGQAAAPVGPQAPPPPRDTAAFPGAELEYDRPPKVVKQARPKYPKDAFLKRIEGTVLIEAMVDTKGRVVSCRIVQSVLGLDGAALDAARKWRFEPAIKGGRPVASIIHMPVAFRIYYDKPK